MLLGGQVVVTTLVFLRSNSFENIMSISLPYSSKNGLNEKMLFVER